MLPGTHWCAAETRQGESGVLKMAVEKRFLETNLSLHFSLWTTEKLLEYLRQVTHSVNLVTVQRRWEDTAGREVVGSLPERRPTNGLSGK